MTGILIRRRDTRMQATEKRPREDRARKRPAISQKGLRRTKPVDMLIVDLQHPEVFWKHSAVAKHRGLFRGLSSSYYFTILVKYIAWPLMIQSKEHAYKCMVNFKCLHS